MATVDVVYVGTFQIDVKRSTGGIGFLPLAYVGTDLAAMRRNMSLFDPKGSPHLTVGRLYHGEGDIDPETGRLKTLSVGSLTADANWQQPPVSSEVRAAWQAKDEAARLQLRAIAREKALAKNTPLLQSVDVIRRAYRNVGPSHRNAFKVWLLDQLSNVD